MLKKIFILFLLVVNTMFTGFSQDVKVSSKIDSTKILIGDHVKMQLNASYKKGPQLTWPDLKENFSDHISIINQSKIDTTNSDDSVFIHRTYILTSYDSGSFYIPSITFRYKNSNDTAFHLVLTDSLLLNVNTMAVDTTKSIKDIKGPMSAPYHWTEIIPYVVGGLAIAAIVWFLFYYFKNRKKGFKLIDFSKPALPAHEEALLALENLKNKKLWQNNKVKQYYTELTEIIRIYIENRFSVAAMEMTSDEIFTSFRSIDISEDLRSKLKQLFVLADLVKFAKATPLPNEHDLSFYNAESFVRETIPLEPVKSEENSHV